MYVNAEKRQHAVQIPPQNYIKPKNKSFFKDKRKFKTSFRVKKKESEDEKNTYKIELI